MNIVFVKYFWYKFFGLGFIFFREYSFHRKRGFQPNKREDGYEKIRMFISTNEKLVILNN